ncbi:MAG: hypothetical protein GY820_31370, partial [Gammaproteobacteria bacterium]|nr:hypothetical protein [Gammaproteobacteria bacterium]
SDLKGEIAGTRANVTKILEATYREEQRRVSERKEKEENARIDAKLEARDLARKQRDVKTGVIPERGAAPLVRVSALLPHGHEINNESYLPSERVLTQSFPISTTILPNAGKGEISESLNELSGNAERTSQNVPPYTERENAKTMMICSGNEHLQNEQQLHYRREDTTGDPVEMRGEREHHLVERDLGDESAWICD